MGRLFWLIFDRILDLLAALAGLILVFIVTAVCYTIGMRYLFTRTTIWITQTTEYALLWIVFLATTWLLREGGHITTDIVYTHLQEKTKRTLDGVMLVIGFACGPDSIIGEIISREVRRPDSPPLTTLVLDEHTGEAGVATRVEAFVDLIRRARKHPQKIS